MDMVADTAAAERRYARQAPYLALVAHGSAAIGYLLGSLLVLAVLPLYLVHHLWSLSVCAALAWGGALCIGRLHLAAAKWAWHSITTGEAFTWPYHRTS